MEADTVFGKTLEGSAMNAGEADDDPGDEEDEPIAAGGSVGELRDAQEKAGEVLAEEIR